MDVLFHHQNTVHLPKKPYGYVSGRGSVPTDGHHKLPAHVPPRPWSLNTQPRESQWPGLPELRKGYWQTCHLLQATIFFFIITSTVIISHGGYSNASPQFSGFPLPFLGILWGSLEEWSRNSLAGELSGQNDAWGGELVGSKQILGIIPPGPWGPSQQGLGICPELLSSISFTCHSFLAGKILKASVCKHPLSSTACQGLHRMPFISEKEGIFPSPGQVWVWAACP